MFLTFDKNSIEDKEFSWFKAKLHEEFKISTCDKSIVIFGFNGIGKTTLFKCIKMSNQNHVEYLQYGKINGLFGSKNSKKLTISTNIQERNIYKKIIDEYNEELNFKKNIQSITRISNKKSLDDHSLYKNFDKITDGWSKKFEGFTSSRDNIEEIINMLGDIPAWMFFENYDDISKFDKADDELKKAQKQYFDLALKYLNLVIDENQVKCPVCDSTVSNLKNKIEDKIDSISKIRSTIFDKFNNNNLKINEENINNLICTYKKLNENKDLISDFILCGGNLDNYDKISDIHKKIESNTEKLNNLQNIAKQHYEYVKSVKTKLIMDLKRYFNVDKDKIEFDDYNYQINIEFPRNNEKYSTGEKNLIEFLYKIYSFLGSDNKTLIIDDPASSLDLVNQYKIAYEIVKNSTDKKLIVLTHSVNLVNIINSQYPGKLKFYYIEELGGLLKLIEIKNCNNSSNPNLISLHRLEHLDDTGNFKGFIQALKDRDSLQANNNLYNLFHYCLEEVTYKKNNIQSFSNFDLSKLIEEFSDFSPDTFGKDFYFDSRQKILYLVALRIWVEKQLYYLLPESNQNDFFKENTLQRKIWVVFKDLEDLTHYKEILQSKKVMLNQAIHFNSQIMPFEYAINLSLDTIKEEINEMKSIFNDLNKQINNN